MNVVYIMLLPNSHEQTCSEWQVEIAEEQSEEGAQLEELIDVVGVVNLLELACGYAQEYDDHDDLGNWGAGEERQRDELLRGDLFVYVEEFYGVLLVVVGEELGEDLGHVLMHLINIGIILHLSRFEYTDQVPRHYVAIAFNENFAIEVPQYVL